MPKNEGDNEIDMCPKMNFSFVSPYTTDPKQTGLPKNIFLDLEIKNIYFLIHQNFTFSLERLFFITFVFFSIQF